MATDVELTVEDGIGWLTLRKPDTRNAVEPEFVEAAIEALDKLPDGIGALVLAGEGPAFCVGVNLNMTQRLLSDGQVEELHRLLDAMHTITRKLRALPVPTVAAVEGAAAGAGVGLACACDLRVVGASTVFVPGFQALGLSPDSGTSFHLARALGSPAAIAAFLRNRRITADELLACSLADEVVPDGEVWAAAQRLAGEVAGAAPAALLATRRLIDAAPTHSFDEHLDAEELTIKGLLTTADVAEGVAAFVERRRPKFTGA
ncbi:MAG TPA: enoyl-CoA hydratase/isomerase family protein [Acidimicrobiia bacterium]|jgi:2-(1,2-epoxy-1,2-dihydrophenyl)acetyl-CoA isomerase|nr:enoyl-CoA hydratase/isomerase family protein [Acidimicrobiia bacterium]